MPVRLRGGGLGGVNLMVVWEVVRGVTDACKFHPYDLCIFAQLRLGISGEASGIGSELAVGAEQ